jgi:hypothetical protein
MQNNKDNNYLVFMHILINMHKYLLIIITLNIMINMRKYWYKYVFVNKYQCCVCTWFRTYYLCKCKSHNEIYLYAM